MAEISWTEQSLEDLGLICQFISRDAPQYARIFANDVFQATARLEEYPKSVIDVYIDVIEADSGTRTAGINAASVALADAGIAMRDLVASIAAGLIGKTPVLDLEGKEEDESKCDIPVAYMPRSKKISLIQMDGDLTAKETSDIINLAIKGCEQIIKKQQEALRKRWEK